MLELWIPGREDILEVLSHARPPIFIPNKWDTFDPFFDAWGYTLDGEKTVQQALDAAAAAIQDNLDQAQARRGGTIHEADRGGSRQHQGPGTTRTTALS